jgi:hypothetical protein
VLDAPLECADALDGHLVAQYTARALGFAIRPSAEATQPVLK